MKSLFLCSALLTLAACQSPSSLDSSPATPHELKPGAKNVGILVFDGLFITEFAAPFDVYKHTGDKMNVFTVGLSKSPITTYEGVVLHPDHAMSDAPRIDVLVVPSGIHSTAEDLENKKLVGFVQRTAAQAQYVTSHCWGAFTLAKAGCLDGRECTTFPASIDDLQKKFPAVRARKDERFVVADRVITSNGGLAAFEAALYVVEQMHGKKVADEVASGLVFAGQNRTYSLDPILH